MARERDKNRKMFHKGHYEVIAARFREQVSRYVDEDDRPISYEAAAKCDALYDLWDLLSDRFEFDNEDFDKAIFAERCGVSVKA